MEALENQSTLSEENSHDFFSSLLPETTFWLRPSIARSVVSLLQGVSHLTPSLSFAKPEPQRRPLSLVRSDAGCSVQLAAQP